jgi:hypothetical protein
VYWVYIGILMLNIFQKARKRPLIMHFYEEFSSPPAEWDNTRHPHEHGTKYYRSHHAGKDGLKSCQRVTKTMKNSYTGL